MRRGRRLSTPLPRRRVNCRAAIINFVRRCPGKARAIGGEAEEQEGGGREGDRGGAGGGREVDARRDVTVRTSTPRFEMSSRFDEKDKTRKRPSRK